MTQSNCPRCGAKAAGNFCASCGAALAKRHCTECGSPADPGSRFCTTCGTPVAGAGGAATNTGATPRAGAQAAAAGAAGANGTRESTLGWWLAGAMLIGLMAVVAYPILRQDEVALVPPTTGAPFSGAGGAGAVDLSSMTPRQAADQLFERVMRTASAGDSASVAFFVPMAIQAYANAEPLDADGLFHLSTLERTAGDFATAIVTADRGLEIMPDHLLVLYAKGEAQMELADTAGARETFQTLLDVWAVERASGNEDYQAHINMLPEIQTRALEVVNGG